MNLLKKVVALEKEANNFGFDWENADQIMKQIYSECLEIHEHLKAFINTTDKTKLQEEIGDLLHAVFSLTVFCELSPKETLEKALLKFERRFKAVKNIATEKGLTTLEGHSFEERMVIWDKAKELVG